MSKSARLPVNNSSSSSATSAEAKNGDMDANNMINTSDTPVLGREALEIDVLLVSRFIIVYSSDVVFKSRWSVVHTCGSGRDDSRP